MYVSEEGHFSIHKAARLLGIGTDNVRTIRTDDKLRIDLRELERYIREDRDAGFTPACVVANAGSANSGAFDPLSQLADTPRRKACGSTWTRRMEDSQRCPRARSHYLQA